MNTFRASWLTRRFTDNDFKSLLRDVVLRDGVGRGVKRPLNATTFEETNAGELIEPQAIRDFIKVLNKEVQVRNEFYKNSPSYTNLPNVSTTGILQESIILASPYTTMQVILTAFCGDEIPNFNTVVPSDFYLIQQGTKSLYLACGENFARLEFVISSVENTQTGVRLTFNHTQPWFSLGRTDLNRDYTSLKNILAKAGTGEVQVGIANFQRNEISWCNNITLAASTLTITESPNTGNPNKATNKQVISGYLDFELDLSTEATLLEKLKGAVITAARFNKFKQLLNRAEVACLCDCNYCTCDCNYCTCDCNYCTCNCNYCTCDCNYCTCNCNYCTCNSNRDYSYYTSYGWRDDCTCDMNYTVIDHGYGNIERKPNPIYRMECACQSDRSSPVYNAYGGIAFYTCSCQGNWRRAQIRYSYTTSYCSCNTNNRWNRAATGMRIYDGKTTGQID